MISLKQLSYALAAQKTLHFRKAAEICNISQSALSTALSELERDIGLQIFERNNKKVLVTPIGKKVLDQAREIIMLSEQLQQFANSQKDPLCFPLTIGVIPTIAPFLLPDLLVDLKKHHPDSPISVVEGESSKLVDMVRYGDIDTAIIATPFPCKGLISLDFWEEDFYWVTKKNQISPDTKEITGDEIKKSDLMLLSEGHCLKNHVLDICKMPKDKLGNNFNSVSLHSLIQMVKKGIGTTLIPEMALKQLACNDDEISAVHVNEPSPHRRISFIIRPNYTRTASVEELISICKTALSK